MRTDATFNELTSRVEATCGLTPRSNDEPPEKRQRVTSTRLKDHFHEIVNSCTNHLNQVENLKSEYIESIDVIKDSLSARFAQDDLDTLMAIETILIKAINGHELDVSLDVLKCFKIINIKILENELKELPTFLKIFNQESSMKIKNFTMISTICDIMNMRPSFKRCNEEIHKLLLLYATMPLSSATAERTFSVMRRLKTWLRSTMADNQLNNRMFAAIHRERMKNINVKKVASDFVKSGDLSRRLFYFGKADD